MSFILDALKKSESERQRRSTPGIADVPESLKRGKAPRWIWALAALLAINAAVLAGLWLKPGSEPAVAEAESRPAPVPGATQADSFSRMVSAARDAATPPAAPADAAGAETVDAGGSSGSEPGAAGSDTPAGASAGTAATTSPRGDAAPLATFDELRAEGALRLPDLHLDIHVYSEKPGDRFVFVNMNKYREQGKLEEGPLVKEIGPDGVVLEHQGTEFLLPRN